MRCIAPALLHLLSCGALLLGACGESSGDDGVAVGTDGSPDDSDAAPIPCDQQMPLELGHCIDTDTGEPCLDFESPNRQFVLIEPNDVVPSVIGLQGSPMFVMAVRAEGIVPGENELAPAVDVEVTVGEELLGAFTSRPIVEMDPMEPSMMRAPQLYVVAFFADDYVGQIADLRAQVTDQAGQQFCAETTFEVGELIESPIIH